jgi:hypothetical protein
MLSQLYNIVENNVHVSICGFISLLEILSYATTPHATGMQLPVACNYFCNYAPFLGVYATMV